MSTMSSESPTNGTPSVTELVSGIVGDVQDLGRQHFELFRQEIREDVRKASDAAASLAVGLAVLQIGVLLFCLMFVYLLASVAPSISLWGCFGIIGGLVSAIGLVAVLYGVQKFKSVESLSNQTAEIMKDDARWLSQPK